LNTHASQANTAPSTAKSVSYQITGMHCGGCVSKVEKILSSFATQVKVTLDPAQAVMSEPKADIIQLNQALANIGDYKLSVATPVTLTQTPSNSVAPDSESWLTTYQPLLLIIGYILITTIAIELTQTNNDLSQFSMHRWMMNFMAGFFLVFSFFKLLNIKAFASSYAMYDLLAQRIPSYGFIYPFIELVLGLSYVLHWQPTITNTITLVVMAFSSLGVIRAVLNKQKIRCACLGSVFNLPMSTITIIEDLTMAGMAAWMLV
jgi:copper chaperone CopZ